eukprot:EG_transcript_3344
MYFGTVINLLETKGFVLPTENFIGTFPEWGVNDLLKRIGVVFELDQVMAAKLSVFDLVKFNVDQTAQGLIAKDVEGVVLRGNVLKVGPNGHVRPDDQSSSLLKACFPDFDLSNAKLIVKTELKIDGGISLNAQISFQVRHFRNLPVEAVNTEYYNEDKTLPKDIAGELFEGMIASKHENKEYKGKITPNLESLQRLQKLFPRHSVDKLEYQHGKSIPQQEGLTVQFRLRRQVFFPEAFNLRLVDLTVAAGDAVSSQASSPPLSVEPIQDGDEALLSESDTAMLKRIGDDCTAFLQLDETTPTSFMKMIVWHLLPPIQEIPKDNTTPFGYKLDAAVIEEANKAIVSRRYREQLENLLQRNVFGAIGQAPTRFFYVPQDAYMIKKTTSSRLYLAFREEDMKAIALKMFHYEHYSEEHLQKRFNDEVKGYCKFGNNHGIVTYYGCRSNGTTKSIALELMECDLRELVSKWHKDRTDNPLLSPVRCAGYIQACRYIMASLLSALFHAWCSSQRLVHRDIHPGNIMVDHNMVVKLVDLEMSRPQLFGEKIVTKTHPGCDYFCEPKNSASIQTDIFSLGMVLAFMLSNDGRARIPDDHEKQFLKNLRNSIVRIGIFRFCPHKLECALDLIDQMAAYDAKDRKDYAVWLCHPFFWSDYQSIDFLSALGWLDDFKKSPTTGQAKNSDLKKEITETLTAIGLKNWAAQIMNGREPTGEGQMYEDPKTDDEAMQTMLEMISTDKENKKRVKPYVKFGDGPYEAVGKGIDSFFYLRMCRNCWLTGHHDYKEFKALRDKPLLLSFFPKLLITCWKFCMEKRKTETLMQCQLAQHPALRGHLERPA